MTGPENYLRAEELLDAVASTNSVSSELSQVVMVQIAQVHATLALAAATAMAACIDDGITAMATEDFRAWDRVAGVQP